MTPSSRVQPHTISMSIDECRLIEFPKISDLRGNLTFLESDQQVPFEIKRVFYIYDVPAGETRGGHAHKTLHQLIVCLAGGFDVLVDDGRRRNQVRLTQPWQGLYVPPMIWDTELNFDPGSLCLVLASHPYSEDDYYRDYAQYCTAMNVARPPQK